MLRWGGLRFRLVLLVLTALVPVVALVVLSVEKTRDVAVSLATARLQSDALTTADQQERLIGRVAQLLNDIASSPSIKDPRISLCAPYLKNLRSQDSRYANLGVVGLDGKVACHALNTDADADLVAGDRFYFKRVLATHRFSVGEYSVGRASGRPVLSLGTPVYGSDGVLNGVAFAAVDLDFVAKALEADPLFDGAQRRMIDRSGTVLAAYPPTMGMQGKREGDGVVLQAATAGHAGMREALDASGIRRMYAYAPVGDPGNGLFVTVSVPRDAVMAGPQQAFLLNIFAVLGVTVFAAVAAWWVGGRLVVRPANAILWQSSEVARGNLAARVAFGTTDHGELGIIGRSFNHMAESLQARQAELGVTLRKVEDERTLLNLIIDSMSDGVLVTDKDGHLLLCNATLEGLLGPRPEGSTLDEWRLTQESLTLDGKTVYPLAARPLTQALRGVSMSNFDVLSRRPGREDRILRTSGRPLLNKDKQLVGGVGLFVDITDLKAAEDFVRDQREVLARMARGAPLSQSLEAIVRLIEAHSPGSLCSILLVKDGKLHHGAAMDLPESTVRQIDGLAVAEGVGACGTAAFRKQPVIVEDVATDPLMRDFIDVAEADGLKACWATPVLSTDGEVLATFAIYHRTPGKPDAGDMELIGTASRLASIALERARAEVALVGSEARFRELAENIQDVFYNRDGKTGRIVYVSPYYEKIWGRSCQSLYADPGSYLDAVLPEDRHIPVQADAITRVGGVSDVEYRIVAADGQTRWIRDNACGVLDAAGELERVVGTARDITDRKLIDLRLASTNRALQMLSRSSIAINRMDDEAHLLAEVCRVAVEVGDYRMAWVGYVQNDELHSIRPMAHAGVEAGYLAGIHLSWSDDKTIGQGPAGLAIRSGLPQQSGDISQAGAQFHWQDAALQRGYRSALCLPLRDGQRSFGVLCLYSGEAQHFLDDEIGLLQELADNLAFGIGSLRARQERRRSQEATRLAALKVQEQASLLDRAQDAIMVRNLDRTLRYWNKGAERMYGWTATEVLGNTMEDRMYRHPQVLADAMQQTLANDGDWNGELEQLARDGSAVWVEARWTVVRDEQGRVNGVLGINTDIRERKRAREEILKLNASLEERVQRRTVQLEFANKQLESFSYSVSHDLRTPLSTVDGFSNLLEKSLAKADTGAHAERSQHYLKRIRAGVTQMGDLIDAMLSLAQISRSTLQWEPADLSAMAVALLDGYQEREPGRPALVQVEPGLVAQGDPRLLRQVLDNLLGNAWKFSAGKERTEITFGHEIGSAQETVYFVRDKGAGFDMAYAEKLFEAFHRLHSPSEFAGSGIGLTTVQRIILRHGGRVWADSVPGQGTTFFFTLGAVKF